MGFMAMDTDRLQPPAPGLWASVTSALTRTNHWFAGVLGADKYQRYLEYHAAHGQPGVMPLSEKEFWRQWQDHQQNNPQGRCC